MYSVTNPATGEVVERFETATDLQIRAAVGQAHDAFAIWRVTPVAERAKVLAVAAGLVVERIDELAEIITLEMGKLLPESKGELHLVADIFRYYAEHGLALLEDEQLTIRGAQARIQKDPVGVLLGIMPWNYPYYQVARFAAPNLLLGNTIMLKHAPACPRSSAAIARLIHDAGVPAAAYVNIYASNDQVADIIADPRVQGVSLTGSERAGRVVAAQAGRHLKKVVLELGGSDPMIILDSDDLDATVELAAASRLENTGQACNAPKRMIVMADLYDEFVEKLGLRFASYTVGDPQDPATTLAPLSSMSAAERVLSQVSRAVSQGATLRVGGYRAAEQGAYIQPTVLTDVTPEMDIYREEVFGPVAMVFRVDNEEQAVALANDTPFGLGASVFSSDVERACRIGSQIEAGMVYVNAPAGSQADLPFGGIKRSGVGRELGSLGIEEFMNKKIVRY
ncbi:NAD-dependent succinate-semialdehyde dehydrogenase [Micromonospora sp. NPDC048830]|uniref:NAD-dependent succinate-semialdehyde dehydrogenase n=1 Tax=Micromonospora sp. NPDC048830 TaxID=3364257 RepID=UPI00371B1AF4